MFEKRMFGYVVGWTSFMFLMLLLHGNFSGADSPLNLGLSPHKGLVVNRPLAALPKRPLALPPRMKAVQALRAPIGARTVALRAVTQKTPAMTELNGGMPPLQDDFLKRVDADWNTK
jgi:hypothetical protein